MSTRPLAAMTDTVAQEIVRQHHGDAASIAVLLAETISTDGRWSPNVCKPRFAVLVGAGPPGSTGHLWVTHPRVRGELPDLRPAVAPTRTRHRRCT